MISRKKKKWNKLFFLWIITVSLFRKKHCALSDTLSLSLQTRTCRVVNQIAQHDTSFAVRRTVRPLTLCWQSMIKLAKTTSRFRGISTIAVDHSSFTDWSSWTRSREIMETSLALSGIWSFSATKSRRQWQVGTALMVVFFLSSNTD